MKKVRQLLTRRLRRKVRVLMRELLRRRQRRNRMLKERMLRRGKKETAMSKMPRNFVNRSRLTSSWWTIRLLMTK